MHLAGIEAVTPSPKEAQLRSTGSTRSSTHGVHKSGASATNAVLVRPVDRGQGDGDVRVVVPCGAGVLVREVRTCVSCHILL